VTAHAYTEKALVEQAAMEVLSALAWTTVSADEEIFGPTGTLGRESPSEVVAPRLRASLLKLNPSVPPAAVALDELLRDRVAMGPAAAANRDVHRLLTAGVNVTVKDAHTLAPARRHCFRPRS